MRSGYSLRNKRLISFGFTSYQSFLASPYWKAVRRAFKEINQQREKDCCIVCKNLIYDIHHRSYQRICQERFIDLLPLCRECHNIVHDSKWNLWDINKALESCFHLSKKDVWKLLNDYGIQKHWKRGTKYFWTRKLVDIGVFQRNSAASGMEDGCAAGTALIELGVEYKQVLGSNTEKALGHGISSQEDTQWLDSRSLNNSPRLSVGSISQVNLFSNSIRNSNVA